MLTSVFASVLVFAHHCISISACICLPVGSWQAYLQDFWLGSEGRQCPLVAPWCLTTCFRRQESAPNSWNIQMYLDIPHRKNRHCCWKFALSEMTATCLRNKTYGSFKVFKLSVHQVISRHLTSIVFICFQAFILTFAGVFQGLLWQVVYKKLLKAVYDNQQIILLESQHMSNISNLQDDHWIIYIPQWHAKNLPIEETCLPFDRHLFNIWYM